MSKNEDWFTGGGRGGLDWTLPSITLTGEQTKVGTGRKVDCRNGELEVLMPVNPFDGQECAYRDLFRMADINNITLNPGDESIEGISDVYVMNAKGQAVGFVFDATRGWLVITSV